MKSIRHFSVGTATDESLQPVAGLIADAVTFLVSQRNLDGTWGGTDNLDRLISTNHALMALLACGFSSADPCVRPGLSFLSTIDKEANTAFFWRAGVFLNLPEYEEIVSEDILYIWKYRTRIGAHKDYPVPFFLLKLLRFAPATVLKSVKRVKCHEVLKWVLSEWNSLECWYGRTSITSMALALVHDMHFSRRKEIIKRSLGFLASKYQLSEGTGLFNVNIVDDAFVVFNLCERNCLEFPAFKMILNKIPSVVKRIIAYARNGVWESPPPFGGTVGSKIYPTAVMVRALMAYYLNHSPTFCGQVACALVSKARPKVAEARIALRSFWGDIPSGTPDENLCFILMPFSPPSLTQIYERYIKKPIEKGLDLKCMRADDIDKSSDIMRDIWNHINRARVIVAELTDKNPNVFYELGLAHVLGKRVILISQSVDFIPFDLRSIRTIIYKNEPKGYEDLAAKVVKYVRTELEHF